MSEPFSSTEYEVASMDRGERSWDNPGTFRTHRAAEQARKRERYPELWYVREVNFLALQR